VGAWDATALALAFAAHRSGVHGYFRRRLRDDDRAEDLTQEVFAAATRYAANGKGLAPSVEWLYAVARRRLVDEIRARKREPQWCQLSDECELPTGDDQAPPLASALLEEIAALPPPQQRVVVLRCLDGLSFAEIAAALRSTEPGCKMRFERARRTLLQRLTMRGISLVSLVIPSDAFLQVATAAGVGS
jgi:RNA polymerase sigma-70 factor (ECF subfamily)